MAMKPYAIPPRPLSDLDLRQWRAGRGRGAQANFWALCRQGVIEGLLDRMEMERGP